MKNETKFDGIFTDAVTGLVEFYPILKDESVINDLRVVIKEHYDDTGNDQNDYENLRNLIEHAVNEDEDIVRDDLRDSVRRIQSGGHATPVRKR